MFMLAAILSRSGRMPGRERDLDHLASMLLSYARRLQREDGVFVHFTDGRIAVGTRKRICVAGADRSADGASRESSGARAAAGDLSPSHERHEGDAGARRHVAPGRGRAGRLSRGIGDGDDADRMARGIRLGWLDSKTYRPIVDRAWRALAAHITGDGAIVDICTSTGSQATLRQYLDRAAISGFDDRGGAMALLAALEMHELH